VPDDLRKSFGKPIMITDFGTDIFPGVYNTPPRIWTEEYQARFGHEKEAHDAC